MAPGLHARARSDWQPEVLVRPGLRARSAAEHQGRRESPGAFEEVFASHKPVSYACASYAYLHPGPPDRIRLSSRNHLFEIGADEA